MSDINVTTNAFTCHQEDDLALITILDGVKIFLKTISGKDEILETLNVVKRANQIKGLAILYSDEYQGDTEYERFMKEVLESKDYSTDKRFSVIFNSTINLFLEEIRAFPKPIVGGMNGDISSTTFAFNLAFDFRIATENTCFIHPNLKLGLPPFPPLAYFLVQSLGPIRTTELIFSKSEITAKDALELGLITKVVSKEDLKMSCFDQLRNLITLPGNTLVATRCMLQPEISKMREYFDAGFDIAIRCMNEMKGGRE